MSQHISDDKKHNYTQENLLLCYKVPLQIKHPTNLGCNHTSVLLLTFSFRSQENTLTASVWSPCSIKHGHGQRVSLQTDTDAQEALTREPHV